MIFSLAGSAIVILLAIIIAYKLRRLYSQNLKKETEQISRVLLKGNIFLRTKKA
jgi:ABC-type nickel/cobalt efflux system permease component RcnA